MSDLRFGIVGAGKIFPTHVTALRSIEGVRLTAFFDSDANVACRAEEAFDLPAAPTWEEFLSAVDVVVVCTPSGYHAEVGIRAALAGKHVVVEKPIDVTLEAAARLVDTCRQSGLKLACISQHRFAREIRRLHDEAQSGGMGRLLIGDAAIKWYRTQLYYDSGEWRGTWKLDGGGCLMNQGVHYIDMIQWIMGGVKSVQALCRTINHEIEVEDVAAVIVEYRNGAVGTIRGTTCCYPEMAERLEVHGTHGSVVLERDRVRLWHIDPVAATEGQYGGGVMMQPAPAASIRQVDEQEEDPTAQWGEQHRLQLEDFAAAIRENREPYMTGEMALEPLKVIQAIYQSSREGGRRVEVG